MPDNQHLYHVDGDNITLITQNNIGAELDCCNNITSYLVVALSAIKAHDLVRDYERGRVVMRWYNLYGCKFAAISARDDG